MKLVRQKGPLVEGFAPLGELSFGCDFSFTSLFYQYALPL
jgi:hypothetical protein